MKTVRKTILGVVDIQLSVLVSSATPVPDSVVLFGIVVDVRVLVVLAADIFLSIAYIAQSIRLKLVNVQYTYVLRHV